MFSNNFVSDCNLNDKFNSKIKYNFRLHVFVCSKKSSWSRQDILLKIYSLNGYRCHKVVKYGTHWSHIHIKFTGEQQAKDAVDIFKKPDSDLTAGLVDDLLKAWYAFELKCNYSPPCTFAIIDVVGTTPKSMNFLTDVILNSIFEDFGRPYLLPYTAALVETHVQVVFTSMTEAFAACVAFGQWYRLNQKTDQFYHRVRISPSQKEALMIIDTGGFPEEAFKLDYFLNGRQHVINCSDVIRKQNDSLQNSRSHQYRRMGTQKSHKQNYEKSRSHRRDVSQTNIRTPLMCIPVIAPLNGTSAQAHVVPDHAGGSKCVPDIGVLRLHQNDCVEVVNHGADTVAEEAQVCSSSEIRERAETLCGACIQRASQYTKLTGADPLTNSIKVSNFFRPASGHASRRLGDCRGKGSCIQESQMIF